MGELTELLYGKQFADALEEFQQGLTEIETKYKDFFTEKDFSSYYIIVYPPNLKFSFREDYEKLPSEIISETKELWERIFSN